MKILLATNGEKHSENAIDFVGNLFCSFDPEITLLFIGPNNFGELAVRTGLEILKKYNLTATTKIKNGSNIFEEIIFESENGFYDLLALGSRGISSTIPGVSSYVLGDIPREVIMEAKISMLVVKEPERLEKILIAVDASEASKEAALFWGSVLVREKRRWENQKVVLLTVIPEPSDGFSYKPGFLNEEQLKALESISNTYTRPVHKIKNLLFEKYGIEARIRLREGNIVEEILKEADKDFDLVVVGRDEVKGHTFGTHLKGIVEQIKIPVLVIRRDAIKKICEEFYCDT